MASSSPLDVLFSECSLAVDDEFLAEVRKTRQGWVPVETVAEFLSRRVGRVTAPEVVAAAEKSGYVVLSEDRLTLRKKHPSRKISLADTQCRSVIVEHLPLTASPEFLRGRFSLVGDVLLVTMVDCSVAESESPTLRQLAVNLRRFPSEPRYALVQFGSEEQARTAAQLGNSGGLSTVHQHLEEEDPKRARSRRGSSDNNTGLLANSTTNTPRSNLNSARDGGSPRDFQGGGAGEPRLSRRSFGEGSGVTAPSGDGASFSPSWPHASAAASPDDRWAALRSGGGGGGSYTMMSGRSPGTGSSAVPPLRGVATAFPSGGGAGSGNPPRESRVAAITLLRAGLPPLAAPSPPTLSNAGLPAAAPASPAGPSLVSPTLASPSQLTLSAASPVGGGVGHSPAPAAAAADAAVAFSVPPHPPSVPTPPHSARGTAGGIAFGGAGGVFSFAGVACIPPQYVSRDAAAASGGSGASPSSSGGGLLQGGGGLPSSSGMSGSASARRPGGIAMPPLRVGGISQQQQSGYQQQQQQQLSYRPATLRGPLSGEEPGGGSDVPANPIGVAVGCSAPGSAEMIGTRFLGPAPSARKEGSTTGGAANGAAPRSSRGAGLHIATDAGEDAQREGEHPRPVTGRSPHAQQQGKLSQEGLGSSAAPGNSYASGSQSARGRWSSASAAGGVGGGATGGFSARQPHLVDGGTIGSVHHDAAHEAQRYARGPDSSGRLGFGVKRGSICGPGSTPSVTPAATPRGPDGPQDSSRQSRSSSVAPLDEPVQLGL